MKRISARIILVICVCLLLCTSCAKTPRLNRKLLPISTDGAISYGLYGVDGEIETVKHFQIDSGSTFEKVLSFGNLIETRRDYKLLIFANYQQLEFSVDGRKPATDFDFVADPQEHVQYTLTFPKLEDGFYDLLFLIIKDPKNESLDEEYRKQTDLSHLISMRYSLQVGEESRSVENSSKKEHPCTENTTLDGVFLNQDPAVLGRLLTLECQAGEEIPLVIHVGNKSNETKEYMVFLLYDWKQTPIDSEQAVFLQIPPMERAAVPVRLEETGGSGVHNVTAICVSSPFEKATMETRKADFSIRVGVHVNE